MKKLVKKVFNSIGIDVKKIRSESELPQNRPVGRMDFFLEDLKSRGLKCNSILDVGANMAKWSEMAKKIFPAANCFLIEPQIEMEEYLQTYITTNPGSKYFLKGAGAKQEKLTFTIYDDLAGSSILPNEDPQLKEQGKQRIIEIITIDSLLESKEISMPDIIKLDIQGHELEALKGAENTFGKTEVYILEISLYEFEDLPGIPLIWDVVNFMKDRNYVVYDFPGFLRRPYDGALGQCDIAFVKSDSFLRASKTWH